MTRSRKEPTPVAPRTRRDRRTPVPKAAKELVLKPDPAFKKRIEKLSVKIQNETEAEERKKPRRMPFAYHQVHVKLAPT